MGNSIKTENTFLNNIFFPPSPRIRLIHHAGFWIFYVLLHYAYAIPTMLGKVADPRVSLVSIIYFLKIVPTYYLFIAVYNFLAKHFKGFKLGLILVVCVLVIQHSLNYLLFFFVDEFVGLENMTPRFKVIGDLYLQSIYFNDVKSWLVLTYDFTELELLLLPAALKVGKYAARQTILRQKLQTEALGMELKVLKTQINPHFVFNVLNAAYAKILPISEEAAEYLQKSSEIIRFALYEANEEFIKLEKEMAYLNQYVQLESIRNTHRCKVSLVQEGRILESHEIPTLLLITLVENAFKHGVHASRHPSFVDIKIFIHPDKLECNIINSVPQRSAEAQPAPEQPTGLGLANLKKRLEIYYPNRYHFETIAKDHTFKVILSMPLTPA